MKAQQTLDNTFALFFGDTEETSGTGAVARTRGGVQTEVVVDSAERAEFLAGERAKADARNAEIERRHRAEARYYKEEAAG